MSAVPLQYRTAELAPGATAPHFRPRWFRLVLWGLAADAVFAASVLGTLGLRGLLH